VRLLRILSGLILVFKGYFWGSSVQGVALTTDLISSAEVKERVNLYICSRSLLSWQVIE